MRLGSAPISNDLQSRCLSFVLFRGTPQGSGTEAGVVEPVSNFSAVLELHYALDLTKYSGMRVKMFGCRG